MSIIQPSLSLLGHTDERYERKHERERVKNAHRHVRRVVMPSAAESSCDEPLDQLQFTCRELSIPVAAVPHLHPSPSQSPRLPIRRFDPPKKLKSAQTKAADERELFLSTDNPSLFGRGDRHIVSKSTVDIDHFNCITVYHQVAVASVATLYGVFSKLLSPPRRRTFDHKRRCKLATVVLCPQAKVPAI
jgi:hypothetical protein